MTPRMFSSTRKCWPSAFFGATVTAARRRLRRSRACGPRARRAPRRALRRALRIVWTTLAGSFDVPRTGCGARYGLSVSTRIRSAGIAAAASRSSRRLRVGRIACEGDVVAPLDGERRRARATRSSGGRPCRRTRASAAAVSSSASRLWITTGSSSSSASPRCASKSRRCCAGVAKPRTVSRPVSPTATAFGCRRSSRSSSIRAASGSAASCGSMPSAAYTPACGRRCASAARHDSIPVPIVTIRVTPASRARSTSVVDGLVARVEVRVRVGHVPASASIRASSSATTSSASSFAKSGAGSRRGCAAGSALGSQRPAHDS